MVNEHITITGRIVKDERELQGRDELEGLIGKSLNLTRLPSDRPAQIDIDYAALERRVLAVCVEERRP